MFTQCNYVITVKDENTTPEMAKYGFLREKTRMYYASTMTNDGTTVSFVCPNYNGRTKEDISPTFSVPVKSVLSIQDLNSSDY